MTQDYDVVTDKQKEQVAIISMRMMLTEFAKRRNISFNEAMLLFAETPVYNLLFDYETSLWKEGPKYLLATFDEYLNSKE